MREFTKFNKKLEWDHDFELSQITNMDETPLFRNITKILRRLLKFGLKEADIETHGQEKVRVTAILCIVADGTKLPEC